MNHLSMMGWCATLGLLAACSGQTPGDDRELEREVDSVPTELRAKVGDAELGRMSAWLKQTYDFADVVETIAFGGDTFDCIARENQASVRALRERGEEVDFGALPEDAPGEVLDIEERAACPTGHIPVRRIPLSELARAGTLDRYLFESPEPLELANHRDYTTVSENAVNYGAQSDINLWGPSVTDNDHSISQIWVGGGSPNTNQRQTVEVGWRKYTWLGETRLFVYANNGADVRGYGKTGGFVQTSNAIALDTTFAALSTDGGTQHERKFTIWKNGDAGDWYFKYQGNTIGFWPRTQFAPTGLANGASDYKFGGEVYNDPAVSPTLHTDTDMGAGKFAAKGFKHAAYQHNLSAYKKVNGAITLVDANITIKLVTSPKCYDMIHTKNTNDAWRNWIYFGGPGYSSANGCKLVTD